ncbi:RND transporter [Salipiger sp. CCB-MM3]|uniref:efflux RND transporter periplasmic adaptor subunit n=1 Tax=Salipiger sp. CCB-MM3 TaxID=1792508 RepID=UPI00080AB505|nr:HlyD family efflux transporter periplasmic adaptor subunit [Salipiger sp. CCB-MM3]ANT60637.1 RND transporter [Salipiger sp. CCB-MM3]
MALNHTRTRTRLILGLGLALLLGVALAAAFWPRPVLVDLGAVIRGPLVVTIDEEGKTEVRDVYVVTTPVAGRLLRVQAIDGDVVVQGDTVAHMRPAAPSVLDLRTREQARAAVAAAQAALLQAKAEVSASQADVELAVSDHDRAKALAARGTISTAALDQARTAALAAQARLETSRAAVAMREAELANAQAQLIGFDDQGLAEALAEVGASDIPLRAPVDGRILQVVEQSETSLAAGAPVLEIGNIAQDLQVAVDLLSSDAVQVRPGARAMLEDWGGPGVLDAEVERIAPLGTTEVSALGVEEQRVRVILRFTAPSEARAALGHGYRVLARIVTWEDQDTLQIPQSAAFRAGADWAVFRVEEGRAVQVPVSLGQGNGIEVQVLEGLSEGDEIVLYPPAELTGGDLVAQRQAG